MGTSTGTRRFQQLFRIQIVVVLLTIAGLTAAHFVLAAGHLSWLASNVLFLSGLALAGGVLLQSTRIVGREVGTMLARLRHQALYDALTGLANRTLLGDRVAQAITLARREGQLVALLLVDLDRFKEVNDTLGHAKGDVLLQEVGKRLRALLRESDTVARLGGDEFCILLPNVPTRAGAAQIAEQVGQALERDFVIDELPVHLDASIGIAIFPTHGEDADELLQHADVAMYRAKESHSGHEIYAASQDPHSPDRLTMAAELRKGLEEDALVLHYQPVVDLPSGEIRGVEALVRWRHPARGLIMPGEFIAMAEHTGLIRPLTRSVLELAIAQCRAWQDQGLDLTIAANLSARNLLDPDLPEDIARLLAKWNLRPGLLELEITESTIMVDPARALEVLRKLDSMGIALAIDDFGTGYSSLAYLRKLPVRELKIDRSFVGTMAADAGDDFIVRSTIELGHNLGLRVVAEGVEDQRTLRRLAELGCDYAQGYYVSRPVPAHELTAWLAQRETTPVPNRAA